MTVTEAESRAGATASAWDRAVVGLPGGTVYQSSMWAKAKGDRVASRIVRLDGDVPGSKAGAQMLIRRLGPLTRAAYVPYGPLFEAGPTGTEEVAPIIAAIERAARTAGCAVLLIQPARGDHVTADALVALGYSRAPVDVATSAALEVDLGAPDEEIFSRLAKYRRKNVRRSSRRGVTLVMGTREDLPRLAELNQLSARRQGFLPMSLPYLERQWDALHPGGHLQLFLARLHGRTVAAGTMLGFGGLAEFKLTGWDGSDLARTCYVNEALNWAMISYANAAGYQVFDLGGLPRDLALKAVDLGIDEAMRGTGSQFKNGWGGEVAVHPATHQRILRPVGHLTYGIGSRLLGDSGWRGRLVNVVRRT